MKKYADYLLVLCLLFLVMACSGEEVDANFLPPQAFQGTWIPPADQNQYIKLTITKTTVIEENFMGENFDPYIDFARDYDSNEFIVTETKGAASYEFTVIRKDGGIIDEPLARTSIVRSYRLGTYNNEEVLELMYPGFSQVFLVRE